MTTDAEKLAKYKAMLVNELIDEDDFKKLIAGLTLTVTGDHNVTPADHGVGVGGDVGGSVVFAESGATVIIGDAPVPMTAVEKASNMGRYLQHIISQNRYLELQGIRSGGKLVHIELDKIYITLRTTQQRIVTPGEWLKAEMSLAPGERHRLEKDQPVTETVTVQVNQALANHRRLAVLGDPGCGKTTLLRYLALVYARDLAEKGRNGVKALLSLPESGYVPVLLPLRKIGSFLRAHHEVEDGIDGHILLLEFLFQSLKSERIDLPLTFFDEALNTGRAVILLDGLDEVADTALRRRVSRLVEALTRAYPNCRYVVTSRLVGYSDSVALGEGYTTTLVKDFSTEDVAHFLGNWHRLVAIGQKGPGPDAEIYAQNQTDQLLSAIEANERVRELAINPLMLTVIAMVHRDRVKLPDRRAELYAEAVDVLLGKRDEARGIEETVILNDRPLDTGDKRLLLQKLALSMHQREQKDISVLELRRWLGEQFYERIGNWPEVSKAVDRFLLVIEARTGLLTARGEGVYAFSHLTFQEYLAALAVAAQDNYLELILPHTADPWWREVILLTAGYLSTQSVERTTRLIQAIARQKQEKEAYHNLVLAAECVRDVGDSRLQGSVKQEIISKLRKDLDTPPPVTARWTTKIGGKGWIERRGAAMNALVRAGSGYWSLPYGEPEWVEIPAGEFWMGEGSALHRVHLDTFFMARTPITNAQYALFVRAADYKVPDHWENNHPPKGQESHPVVNVTWDEAMAYCGWLSGVTGKAITLPTEAHWEKAAHGDKDQRVYPWGNTFDPLKCNSDELGIGTTTPVGIFLNGAGPYGCLDMAGNVFEWTHSLYMDYPYDPVDGREDEESQHRRVLRGGACYSGGVWCRCAYRYHGDPDGWSRYGGFRVMLSPI